VAKGKNGKDGIGKEEEGLKRSLRPTSGRRRNYL
jgi:hypothetical protein